MTLADDHPIVQMAKELFQALIEGQATLGSTVAKLQSEGGFQLPITMSIGLLSHAETLNDATNEIANETCDSPETIDFPEAN